MSKLVKQHHSLIIQDYAPGVDVSWTLEDHLVIRRSTLGAYATYFADTDAPSWACSAASLEEGTWGDVLTSPSFS